MLNKEKGITLIALIVTIVVLIILAGITITGAIQGGEQANNNKQITDLDKIHHAITERDTKYKLTKDESLLIGTVVKTNNIDVSGLSQAETIVWKMVDFEGVTDPEREYYRVTGQDLVDLGLTSDPTTKTVYVVNYFTGEAYNETQKKTEDGKLLYVTSTTEQVSEMGDEIIKDGLLVWYDGENNTGSGHSSTTTVWKDLSGNGNDATLYGFDGTEASGWHSNYLAFDRVNDYASKTDITVDGANGTIEIVAKYISGAYIFRSDASGDRTYITSASSVKGNPAITINYNLNGSDKYSLASRVLKYYTVNNTSYTLNYFNMNKSSEQEYQDTTNGTFLVLGSYKKDKWNQGVNMQLYAIRVYNRALSEDEIHHNYLIDKARFGIEEYKLYKIFKDGSKKQSPLENVKESKMEVLHGELSTI